jgi:hypothetical protein
MRHGPELDARCTGGEERRGRSGHGTAGRHYIIHERDTQTVQATPRVECTRDIRTTRSGRQSALHAGLAAAFEYVGIAAQPQGSCREAREIGRLVVAALPVPSLVQRDRQYEIRQRPHRREPGARERNECAEHTRPGTLAPELEGLHTVGHRVRVPPWADDALEGRQIDRACRWQRIETVTA